MASNEAKVNQRKGHRAYVTRTMNVARDLVRDFHDADQSRLLSLRQSLVEKLDVLKGLDEEILGELTDEDEIEVEIVRSSELRTDMQQLITQIGLLFKKDSVRSREEREPSRNNFAKLPKLSLKSFSGNTIEFQSF